jgi:hypothetical protein
MRKLIALGSSIVLCVALAGCGGDDDDDAGSDGGGGGDFCEQVRGFDADPTNEEAVDALREVADNAPDEISDDINSVVDFFDRLQEGSQDPEEIAELTEEAEDLAESAQRVRTYVEDECGIETEPETTDTEAETETTETTA